MGKFSQGTENSRKFQPTPEFVPPRVVKGSHSSSHPHDSPHLLPTYCWLLDSAAPLARRAFQGSRRAGPQTRSVSPFERHSRSGMAQGVVAPPSAAGALGIPPDQGSLNWRQQKPALTRHPGPSHNLLGGNRCDRGTIVEREGWHLK